MTVNEIRELLPFYAANSLGEAERSAIEEALRNSEELREELSFWQHAKHARQLQTEARAEHHLTNVQIVDYARGAIADASARMNIERHIQSCDECRKIYDVIHSLQPEIPRPTKLKTVEETGWFARCRLAYAIPIVATVLALAVYFLARDQEQKPQITKTPIETPKERVAPKRTVTFTLPFVGAARDLQRERNVPVFVIESDVEAIQFEIPVLHSRIAAHYNVSLRSKVGTAASFDSLLVGASRGELDLLGLRMYTADLREVEYELRVKEDLRKEKRQFEAEEYLYRFEVRRKK